MPFITEELWHATAEKRSEDLILSPWVDSTIAVDQDSVDEMNWVKQFVLGVRKIRSGMNIDPRKPLPVLLQNGSVIDVRVDPRTGRVR